MKLRLLIYAAICMSVLLSTTFYWAFNYPEFTHRKGDEFFSFVKYLLFISITFLLSLQLAVKKINFFLVLIQPVASLLLSFVAGIIILLLSGLDGIPKHNILIFGITYTVFTIMFVYLFWHNQTTKKSNA